MSAVTKAEQSSHDRRLGRANLGDRVFRGSTLLFALAVLLVIALLAAVLTRASLPSLAAFGWGFLTSSVWDPVHERYGAWPAIWGTLYSSLLALLIAVPISLGTAVFLAELAPAWLRNPVSFLVELLAAVPSVVYGLWGIFVLVPAVRSLEAVLGERAGSFPLFSGPPYGIGLLSAGLILAIMILPIITSVSREVLLAVPRTQREAAYSLGATHWETIRGPVFRYARPGLVGAVILGLGRALGETMAVTMVIGNTWNVSLSLFSPGYTMPSVLANEYAEATGRLHRAALMEIALLLFLVSVLVNALARFLLWSVGRGAPRGVKE